VSSLTTAAFSEAQDRGSYIYHNYTDLRRWRWQLRIGRSNGIVNRAVFLLETSTSNLSESSQVANQQFTLDVNNWIGMEAEYRYSRFDVNANANFSSVEACDKCLRRRIYGYRDRSEYMRIAPALRYDCY